MTSAPTNPGGGLRGSATRRIGFIAANTVREAAGQKPLLALCALSAALVVGAQWLREFHFGASELKFVADCGLGALAFFGAALMITATVQLFFSEIDHGTAQTLLAHPVGRGEFILGKLGALMILAAIYCLIVVTLLGAILWMRETEMMRHAPENFPAGRVVSYRGLAAAGLLQWCRLGLLAALGLLVASLARTALLATTLTWLVLIICQLRPMVGATDSPAAPEGELFVTVARILPDFQLFGLADAVTASGTVDPIAVATLVAYAAGHGAIATTLAIFVFCRREL